MTVPGVIPSVGERCGPRIHPPTTLTGDAVATWYTQKGSNDTKWRADWPAEAVGGRVSYLHDRTFKRSCSYPNRDTGIPWTISFLTDDGVWEASTKKEWDALTRKHLKYTDVTCSFPKHEGVAVWTRPDGRRAVIAHQMREAGHLIVAETDDNYLAAGHWNNFQREAGWGAKEIDVITRATASFDRNIFSTRWLRDRYFKEYKDRLGKQHLPEMFVCRNHIPRSAWPERDEGEGKVRVGFMGSPSHVWDINMAYAALHDAKAVTGAEVVMVGYNPAKPDDRPDEMLVNDEVVQIRSEKSKEFMARWDAVIDRHIAWIDPGDYRRAALPLDVGLAPISTANDFTLGKSDAKAIDYTVSGAACVLAGAGIYGAEGWKHEVNCLMASSKEEFARQTVRLCNDPKLRFELVSAAQEYVLNERNEDVMAREWKEALTV